MSLTFSEVAGKVISAVAAATILGGGTVLLNSQVTNAKQDTKIEAVEKQSSETLTTLKDVVKEVSDTNKKLERLIGRLEGRDVK